MTDREEQIITETRTPEEDVRYRAGDETGPSRKTHHNGGVLLQCLLHIAAVHGITATADSLMAGLPLERGLLTPSVFGRAAKRAGLNSRIVRQPLMALNVLLFPVVLLLEGGKACVLQNLDREGDSATVFFPEMGGVPAEVSLEQLGTQYAGYAIYVRPEFHFDDRAPEVEKTRGRHWFWGVIAENRPLYRDLIVATVMINLFALAMPLFVMNVYNRVVPNRAVETLWVLSAVVFLVLTADFALRMMRGYFVDLAAVRTNVKLSASIFEKVMGLRMEEKPASVGSFAANLQAFESVRNFISSAAVTAYVDLPFGLVFVAVIALIAWPLAVPILVGGGLMILYALSIQGKMRDLSQTTNQASALRNSTLVENLVAMETVKALGLESRAQTRWERVVVFLERTGARLRLLSSSVANGAMWSQFSVSVVVMIIGVHLIMDSSLSMGGLIAAYMLSSRAMSPISRTATLLTQYHQSARALASLDEIMKKEVERPENTSFDSRHTFRGAIEFRNVSFSYPEQETPALKKVSLRLRPGERVAILGRVGSGKSTLSRLLLGLFRPTEGEVLLDGIDLRQLDPAELRRNVGYVPQDVTLFYGTLRENIMMAAPPVPETMLFTAAKLGGMEAFVNAHPKGLDLQVGERGERLSSGQRQGVAIARAVIKNPPILLLDEPTSSVDHSTEEIIKENLRRYVEGKTLIVVTHKTSLLDLVDRIVVMDGGRIVADGPRDKVLKALREGQVKGGKQ